MGFRVSHILRRSLQPSGWGPLVRKSRSRNTLTETIKKDQSQNKQRFTEKFNLIIVKSIQDLEAENEPSTVHTTHGDGE